MAADVGAEVGDVGEAEAVGYFLDGGGGVAQVVAHVLDDVLVDPVLGGLAALVLADHREVFGRDGEQVGIVAHGTALHLLLGERGEEAVEELAALRLVGLGLGGVGLVEDAAQAEEHRLDERLHGLLAELAVGHVHGLADEGVVEAVLAHDVVGEADDVGAADIDGAIPDADVLAQQFVDDALGEAEYLALEVGGNHEVGEHHIGATEQHVVLLQLSAIAVDVELYAALAAEDDEIHLGADGVKFGEFADVVDDGNVAVGIDLADAAVADGADADLVDVLVAVHLFFILFAFLVQIYE